MCSVDVPSGYDGGNKRSTRRIWLMCANCGCGIAEDKHGDERNINWSEIVASAEANDLSPDEAVRNIQEMARQQGS
jgi:hypothetical protein